MLGLTRIIIRKSAMSKPYSAVRKMTAAAIQLDNTARMCSIKSEDGGIIGRYPYVWLRDNCQCPQCFHPSSRGRLFLMKDLDPDAVPAAVKLTDSDQTLRVEWPDKHTSEFPLSWLEENQFSNMIEDPVSVPKRHFWGKEMQEKIPSFTFNDVKTNDKSLHDWIEALQLYGLVLMKEAPQKEGALLEIGKRISILKTTNYGETFQVLSKFEASNIAYTNAELGLHTDLPFYAYTPNIQLLHCIKQVKATGGENQFADGYKVAEDLRREDPEAFRVLSTIPVDFRDWGTDYNVYHMKHRTPIIALSSDGRCKAINYNDQVRAPYLQVPVEDISKVYRALKKFHSKISSDDNMIKMKLTEGDIVSFDNLRVLHGRSSYVVTESSTRHLEGAYVDWDEACSRMRVIRDKLLGQKPL